MFQPISSLRPIIPLGNSAKITPTTATSVTLARGAMGLIVQAVDGDVYFAINETADADSFFISQNAVVPTLIELDGGEGDMYISFLEKDGGAGLVYQLVR